MTFVELDNGCKMGLVTCIADPTGTTSGYGLTVVTDGCSAQDSIAVFALPDQGTWWYYWRLPISTPLCVPLPVAPAAWVSTWRVSDHGQTVQACTDDP